MQTIETFLGERWAAEIRTRYAEPHRHYHTFAHVEAVLSLLEGASDAAIAAAYFHDVIYDTRLGENEERSAELAAEAMTEIGFAAEIIDETRRIIVATKTHNARGLTADGVRMLDADLAILGAAPDAYDDYALRIREEYSWVPSDVFRNGRRGVLESFLAREVIYFTDDLRARFERAARENLQRELAVLR